MLRYIGISSEQAISVFLPMRLGHNVGKMTQRFFLGLPAHTSWQLLRNWNRISRNEHSKLRSKLRNTSGYQHRISIVTDGAAIYLTVHYDIECGDLQLLFVLGHHDLCGSWPSVITGFLHFSSQTFTHFPLKFPNPSVSIKGLAAALQAAPWGFYFQPTNKVKSYLCIQP